jgi:hypothetical protein
VTDEPWRLHKLPVTSLSVEDDGKSNDNATIVDAKMKNPTETASSVTTKNGKKAATSSVKDGKSNKNAIIVDSSSDEEDGKKPAAKKTGVTTDEVIFIKGS